MKNTFEIKVNGKSIRHYNHAGNTYVEGKEGTEYSISVKNNNYKRRLFVISVDGINVISGKPASEDQTAGYVINGYDSLDLKGFRINDQDVAAFKFVKSEKSYAKEITGSSSNSGVIGVKVYDEKVKPLPYYPISQNDWINTSIPPDYNHWYSSFSNTNWCTTDTNTTSHNSSINLNCCSIQDTNSVYLKSASTKADFNLGTGWGSKQNQSVVEVDFESGILVGTYLVYYASRKQLEEMGVDLGSKAKVVKQMPSAFGEQKYCPIPKNWKG